MTESTINKPYMRNLLYNKIKKQLLAAFILSTASALAWKYAHTEPMRRKYEHFYSVYDPEKAEQDMLKAGVFSAFPDGKA